MKKTIQQFIAILPLTVILSACMKGQPELPPSDKNHDPALQVNTNIALITDKIKATNIPVLIDSDLVLTGIVTADDRSGNFHNQVIIEDSSAGIALQLNADNLYNTFPIGRKIYVRLKDLYVANYHGQPQLGGTPAPDNAGTLQVSGIPSINISRCIIAGNFPGVINSLHVALKDIAIPKPMLCNRLITIDEAELEDPLYNNIYSDPNAATSIKLQDCSGNKIILRSSNYASFQSCATPWGKGVITGIYTIYNSLPQLVIRDTGDVQFGRLRCDGTVSRAAALVGIDSMHRLYNGTDIVLGAYKITGIVTSDAVHKNNGSAGNIVLQDGDKGLIVYFGSSAVNIPAMGDSVTIDISGATLTRYNGALEIKNIKTSKVVTIATGKKVTPLTLTIAELNAGFHKYESILVKIINARITGSGTYSGNKTLNDGTGTIILYTSPAATFAIETVPAISKTFTGIVTPYNTTKEIKIRNPQIDVL